MKATTPFIDWTFSNKTDCLARQLQYLDDGPQPFFVDADPLHSYTSGVVQMSACCDYCSHNHVTLLVGAYQDSEGDTVYIVKNQWGATWGENGYVYRCVSACLGWICECHVLSTSNATAAFCLFHLWC